MKNLIKTPMIILLFCLINACKKEEMASPIFNNNTDVSAKLNATNTKCRIGTIERVGNFTINPNYDEKGYLIDYQLVTTDNIIANVKFKYEKGNVVELSDNFGLTEKYEYMPNGAISKITIAETTEDYFKNYTIDIETNAKKQIVKMVDSKGYRNDFLRDADGNISLITKYFNDVVFGKIELSGYDDKNSIYGLLKGWQFDHNQYYGAYMTEGARLANGPVGNATKAKFSFGDYLVVDLAINYEYNEAGFPTLINEFNNVSGQTYNKYRFTYTDCKK